MPKFKGAGGPVQAHEIYIEREIDRRVLQLIYQLEYVHIIAPRQMGKTSLVYHLLPKLQEQGWRCIYVDLSTLTSDEDVKWYIDLGRNIGLQLTPERIPQVTNPNDLKTYFVEVLSSTQRPAPIVVFLDEIGSLNRLKTGEQFLMTLRSMYRRPIDFPVLEPLTFVLAGTVDPDAMVKDQSTSPFNVGERVTLKDFNAEQTYRLTKRLTDDDLFGMSSTPEDVHDRVYYWTSGHPYLSQKTCALLEQEHKLDGLDRLTAQDVDRVIYEHFLKPLDSLELDSNIRHVGRGLQDESIGNLFLQICAGKLIPEHPGQSLRQLYLLGAIKRQNGRPVVRNHIYAKIPLFEQENGQENFSQSVALVDHMLGQYHLLEHIAQRGMATVYKGYHPSLDRCVAVKVLSVHPIDGLEFIARFEQEARSVAQLNHPNILPVYDFGSERGFSYIVMCYVATGTLKDQLGKPQELRRTVEVVTQIGAALHYAHRHGVIHRDVKPANILIDEEGRPLLSDFGLVRVMSSPAQLTRSDFEMGTPDYIAPEQAQGGPVDRRVDIYSLGVILYEMLTGRVPFKAETAMAVMIKHIQEPLPLPREINPIIPEEVEQVVLKALAKDPNDRYSTVSEMIAALQNAANISEKTA